MSGQAVSRTAAGRALLNEFWPNGEPSAVAGRGYGRWFAKDNRRMYEQDVTAIRAIEAEAAEQSVPPLDDLTIGEMQRILAKAMGCPLDDQFPDCSHGGDAWEYARHLIRDGYTFARLVDGAAEAANAAQATPQPSERSEPVRCDFGCSLEAGHDGAHLLPPIATIYERGPAAAQPAGSGDTGLREALERLLDAAELRGENGEIHGWQPVKDQSIWEQARAALAALPSAEQTKNRKPSDEEEL